MNVNKYSDYKRIKKIDMGLVYTSIMEVDMSGLQKNPKSRHRFGLHGIMKVDICPDYRKIIYI